MRARIRPNQPLNHAQGFVLSVSVYNSTIFGNRTRREQGNARSWDRSFGTQTEAGFNPSKLSDFYPPLSGIHMAANGWGQAAPFGARHVAEPYTKVQPWLSLTSLFSSPFSDTIFVTYSLSFSPPLLQQGPPLSKLIFAPNSEPSSALEPQRRELRTGTHEFR